MGGDVGRERLLAGDDCEGVIVDGQVVAQQRLLEQLGVKIVADFGEDRFAEEFGEGLRAGVLAEDFLIEHERAGELVPLDEPPRFQHAGEDEAVEELLAGEGEPGQIVGERGRAQGKAVGQDEPPLFEVGEELLIEICLVLLIVAFFDAPGLDVFAREQVPQIVLSRDEVLELKAESGFFVCDADELPLGEIREHEPADRLFHPHLFRADAVIAQVAQDLFAVFVQKAAVGAVEQALGFKKQERPVGIAEAVVHRVTENLELAGLILPCVTECLQQRLKEMDFGGFLRLFLSEARNLESFGFGDEGCEPGWKCIAHRLRGVCRIGWL